MLKIQFKDNYRDPMWIMEKNFSIGSDKTNHLVLDREGIAPFHAKLSNFGDRFVIKDTSDAGVYVNNQRVTQKQVLCNDAIRIGDIEFTIIDPVEETQLSDEPYWSLIADSNWLTGQEFPIASGVGNTVTIGRNNECDIVFPGTHLSRKHASILIERSHLTITDLGSANGTFINEVALKGPTQAYPGDRLRFDVYSFRVFGPGIEITSSNKPTPLPPAEDAQTEPDNSDSPKRWKTRPTSPGNREEPSTAKRDTIVAWLIASAIIGGFAVMAGLLFF